MSGGFTTLASGTRKHVKSSDPMVANQAEGVFLQEMRDSVTDLTGIIRRRTPDPVIHANEFADATVSPANTPYPAPPGSARLSG